MPQFCPPWSAAQINQAGQSKTNNKSNTQTNQVMQAGQSKSRNESNKQAHQIM